MPNLHTLESTENFWRNRINEAYGIVAVRDHTIGVLLLDGDVIAALYVAQNNRRQGIGRALLSHAKLGRDLLKLWTFAANTAAQEFYAREGFRECARTSGDNEEGLPDIQFAWSRPAS